MNTMQSSLIVLFCIGASVLVMSEPINDQCQHDTNCLTNCCINNKCADSPNWCPCSDIKNPCDRTRYVCISRQVQCIRAPCYPIPHCQPRLSPAIPTLE